MLKAKISAKPHNCLQNEKKKFENLWKFISHFFEKFSQFSESPTIQHLMICQLQPVEDSSVN